MLAHCTVLWVGRHIFRVWHARGPRMKIRCMDWWTRKFFFVLQSGVVQSSSNDILRYQAQMGDVGLYIT